MPLPVISRQPEHGSDFREMAMKKITLILTLAFPLTTGMALTTAFALGLLPLLSADACHIAKVGTGQLTHFVADTQVIPATDLPIRF